MLASSTVTSLIGTTKPEIAKRFYGEVLGLRFVSEDAFAAVYEAENMRIRLSQTPSVIPAPYAILAFNVDDIAQTLSTLAAKGVIFLRFPFLTHDDKGIWSAPDGTKVAWFHDPDANMLSLVQRT